MDTKQGFPTNEAPPPYSTATSGVPPGYPAGYSTGPAPPPQMSGYNPQPVGGYNQPQAPGYPAPTYTPGAPIVSQPTLLVQQYRETPVRTACPSCRAEIVTATDVKTGGLTYLIAGILCMSCLWWGPCLIPFCVDSAKDVEHTCPNCKTRVGYFNRLS